MCIMTIILKNKMGKNLSGIDQKYMKRTKPVLTSVSLACHIFQSDR